MDPCETNLMIAALTNHFFTTLTKEEFTSLSVFLNELSKTMFATAAFRDLEEKKRKKGETNTNPHLNAD